MPHAELLWIVLAAGAIVSGGSLVGLLAARSVSERVFAVAGVTGLGISLWAFVSIIASYDRLDAVAYAAIFGAAGLVGGYALASAVLEGLATRPSRPPLPAEVPAGIGKGAVIVLGEVEPPGYSARIVAGALRDLAKQGTLDPSIALLPFIFMAQKMRYRARGGTSPSAHELDLLAERLAVTLERHKNVGCVESAWCRGERALATVILKAVAQGFRTFTIAEAFIAESPQVDAAKREVDALRLESLGVTVSYAQPLWHADRIARLVATRAMAAATNPSTTGVALVGRAQPESLAQERGEFDTQETAFLQRVRLLLTGFGIPEANIRIAWMDWRSPDITGTLRHLEAIGCERIVVSPACFPLDSLETALDIPLAGNRARVAETVSIVTLPAWHDDPGFVEALRSDVADMLGSS
ncbi:MAG: hypothetical protein HGA39_04295 [Coriobacteriia bacterium]|nr:hypothetical protein [Coriobacteriia bacterium]